MGQGERRSTAAPGSDVAAPAPTEDAVMAFLDLLVEPLLPARVRLVAKEPPTADHEATVAKQVQAVVFLYDYYHRKLNPELEYLDFISFCKLAVAFKPSLLTYMKVMQRDDYSELVDLKKEVSLTEKLVMEACELVKGLEDLGTTEKAVAGWPVCKVAVFLVDNEKENCFLLNSSSTMGVWSVIEKESSLDLSPEGADTHKIKKKRITKKPQRGDTRVDEAALKQLAFAAIKDACGYTQSNLKVLETHTVYSLSKEKTAARFYIVQCMEAGNEFNYLPIRDVIDSLQEPLVTKKACSWSTTSAVEYFHLLPYADVISKWFERSPQWVASHEVGLEGKNHDAGQNMDTCETGISLSTTTESIDRADEPSVTIVYKKRNNSHSQKRFASEETLGPKLSITAKESFNVEDNEFAVTQLPNSMEIDEVPPVRVCSINGKSRSLSGEDYVVDKKNMPPSSLADIVEKEADGVQSIKEQNGEHVCVTDKTVLSSQYGMNDHALVPSASSGKNSDKIHAVISSKENVLSQTASKVLLQKRDMLRLQLRKNQEEIALCEKNVGTILRGGADALAVTLDTLIEGCGGVNVTSAIAEERACLQLPTEANLTVRIPSQELGEMCYKNSWPQPIYHESTLEGGGYQSHAEVTGKDFKLSVTGAVCATPSEAKDSAASSIFIKLCNIKAAAS